MTRMAPAPVRTCPTVTVVVPHYNYGRYLPVAVRSALDQDGVDVDVIVVDDASTDGSVEVARRLAASDGRVHLVEHPQNMRHIATYNDGLGRATGDYVVLLSADDALAPGALARATALLEHDPAIGLVYGAVTMFSDEQPPEAEPARERWSVWEGEEWVRLVCRRGANVIVNPEVVMRRSLLDEIGGYVPDLPFSADMYLWLQAAARGRIGRVDGPVQAYYRTHGANMTGTDFGGVLDDALAVRTTFARFFEIDGPRLARTDSLRRLTQRTLAREALLRAVSLAQRGVTVEHQDALRSHASDTWPRVTSTGTWRWASFARGIHQQRWRKPVVDAVERVRWAMRWKRHMERGL